MELGHNVTDTHPLLDFRIEIGNNVITFRKNVKNILEHIVRFF